jgi:hypothetical protein
MLSIAFSSVGFSAPLAHAVQQVRHVQPKMETVSDLKDLAVKCNPVLGYWCVHSRPARRAEAAHALRSRRAHALPVAG